MDIIEITGGNSLQGEIKIQGSKNAALPIIAATILNKGISVLHNCPKIIDVFYMIEILRYIGCVAWWEEDTLHIDASNLHNCEIPGEYATKMRSSIILLGSLLSRMGQVHVPYPGGCVIGARPIDMHLKALKEMGVVVDEQDGILKACAETICGADITLPFPSVGATENTILAAVCAKGTTRISNTAKEPEIVELCRFLNKMGGKITGAGGDEIVVCGVESLHDAEFEIVSDRIVTGTYLLAAAATRGCITVTNPPVGQMDALIEILNQTGCRCYQENNRLYLDAGGELKPPAIVETAPYPGFPTDLQSQMVAFLTTVPGTSLVRENIFEARYKAVPYLQKLGADIRIDGNDAVISGTAALYGSRVCAKELRGGAALVIAGLAAAGKTTITGRTFIDRGYENICRDMTALGGNIEAKETVASM